nr:hypothetical protein [Candidatus Freyarchaeota archaeon]
MATNHCSYYNKKQEGKGKHPHRHEQTKQTKEPTRLAGLPPEKEAFTTTASSLPRSRLKKGLKPKAAPPTPKKQRGLNRRKINLACFFRCG